MSIRSMTGHGRGELASGGFKIAVEVRTVNHRQFEARLDLPEGLAALEDDIRARLHRCIARGYVTCRVEVQAAAAAKRKIANVDYGRAAAVVGQLRSAARKLGLNDDLKASALLAVPGIIGSPSAAVDPVKVGPLVLKCLDRALKALLAMRLAEGRALARDIAARLQALAGIVAKIMKRAPQVADAHRHALQERLRKAGVPLLAGDDRLIKEVALFADRSDITEEAVRLRSHLKQAGGRLAGPAAAGRSLDFLMQEMFREINTIGSKANDADISRMVVQAKAELERIREQVQNVE